MCHVRIVVLPRADPNIALGRPAFQSSVGWNGSAGRGVDGNTYSHYFTDQWVDSGSCLHTEFEHNPMWWVDLGQSFPINRVVIFNRQDPCCWDRVNPFNIHIGESGNATDNPKCGGDHQLDRVNQPSISVPCQGMTGRYVGVRLPGYHRALSLCEVQVFSDSGWLSSTARIPVVGTESTPSTSTSGSPAMPPTTPREHTTPSETLLSGGQNEAWVFSGRSRFLVKKS
ncbi:fucolectin-like isoform X2 [Branchiostoma floridae x Branchiostoma belcheri]